MPGLLGCGISNFLNGAATAANTPRAALQVPATVIEV